MSLIRTATKNHIKDVLTIYNEGIIDRLATLETQTKDEHYMVDWFNRHTDRYKVIVAELDGKVVGWVSLKAMEKLLI